MLKEINNSGMYEVCKFDLVTSTSVYIGDFTCLEPIELEWVKIDGTDCIDYIEVLTLDEIVEQAREKVSDDYIRENGLMITVFIEGPLEGKILQYGNYGNSWWQIAKTSGYA